MKKDQYFRSSDIYRRFNPNPHNTDIPDQVWYLPISSEYAKNIQNLLVKIEAHWRLNLQQQYDLLLESNLEQAKGFKVPSKPMRYDEAVAYQILLQDFQFLEVAAAALGFTLVPISTMSSFDPTQVKLISNRSRIMEILKAHGILEKTNKI